jgi:hypothetical protein
VRTVTPEVVAAPSDRKVGTDAVSKAEPAKQESTAPVRSEEILETVALPKLEPKVTAPAQEKAATVTEVKTPELPVTNQEPMFVQQPVVENEPMVHRAVHVNVEQEQAPKTVRQPVDYSGREAALRDYGKRSADFSAITDSDQRSLIQRMAAEDRGRLAVLKRLANAKASDPKSADKLENSPRTRDVIARSAVSVAREETVPTSFDRNDLRKRKGLDLRVAVVLGGFQLSDKVQEALDPAYLAQLQLPEFELLTDYQVTMVDIRRTRNHLRDLGFSDSSIAPTTEGVRLPMSDALQLLFVD